LVVVEVDGRVVDVAVIVLESTAVEDMSN